MLDLFLVESAKSGVIRQSFVKHQIFAYLTIFSIEFKKRHPALLAGHRNQLIREIRACLPLLSYTNEQLIEGVHVFEASMHEMTREKEIKFFFDSEHEDPKSAPSVPGYLSYIVCEETQMHDDPIHKSHPAKGDGTFTGLTYSRKMTDFERNGTERYPTPRLRDLRFSKTILEMLFSK